MYKYKIVVAFEDKRLENVLKIAAFNGERSKSKVKNKKIYIVAKDATSLRATLDGFIKAMKVFEKTETIK